MEKPLFKKWFNNQDLKRKIRQIAGILQNLIALPPKPTTNESMKAHDITERFWLQPSPIHDWLRSHGIEAAPGVLPRYRDGGAGRAYFVGEYVVKFSANQVEANVALMSVKDKTLHTPIIDVLPLNNGIYAILQHYVDMNASKDIKDAADFVTAIVDEYPDMEGFPIDPTEQERLAREALRDNGGDERLIPYMMTVMTALAKLYNATGFKHDDAGPTNVGMHRGSVAFPDLGPNQTSDFDPDEAMTKIAQNRQKLNLPPWEKI